MKRTASEDKLWDVMRGTYLYSVKEAIEGGAIVLAQFFAVVMLYFNGDAHGLSLKELASIALFVPAGIAWILWDVIRIVVVGQDYIVAHSLFRSFCQKLELRGIEGIKIGGVMRGKKMDFVVDGKAVRFAGNIRFFNAMCQSLQRRT